MKITGIYPHILDIPLPYPIKLSFGEMRSRRQMYVEVRTAEGISGIGEVWTNHPVFNAESKLILFEKCIIPLLKDREFETPQDAYAFIEKNLLETGAGRQWGALGHIMQAISGIDIALWDIYSRLKGLPLCKAINASCSYRPIPAYASGLGPDHIEECVERALDRGYGKFKLKIGFSESKDIENLTLVRSLAKDRELYLDANQKFSGYDEAARRLEAYSKFGFKFVEEPVSCCDMKSMRLLRNDGFTVAAGENSYTETEFSNMLWTDCIDILQPDVGKCGGITNMLRIAALAKSAGKSFAPHMFSSVIGQTASLHVLTAVGGLFMEVDANPNPALSSLASVAPFSFRDGCFYPDDCQGLGVTLDKDFVSKYSVL